MNDQEVFSRSWNSDHFRIQHVQLILNLDTMLMRPWEKPYLHS